MNEGGILDAFGQIVLDSKLGNEPNSYADLEYLHPSPLVADPKSERSEKGEHDVHRQNVQQWRLEQKRRRASNRGGWVRKKLRQNVLDARQFGEKNSAKEKDEENGYQVRLIDSEGAQKSSATCGRESLCLRPLLEE